MPFIKHNPAKMYPQYQSYSHAIEVSSNSRLLIISGLNGYLDDGKTIPESFEEQCEIIWRHLGTILDSAQMTYSSQSSQRVSTLRILIRGLLFIEDCHRKRLRFI